MDVSHHAKLMFQIGHPMTHHSKHVRDEESPFEACRLHQHKETSKKIFNCVLRLIKIEFDCVEFGAITCGAYATRYFKVIVGFIIGNVGIGNGHLIICSQNLAPKHGLYNTNGPHKD